MRLRRHALSCVLVLLAFVIAAIPASAGTTRSHFVALCNYEDGYWDVRTQPSEDVAHGSGGYWGTMIVISGDMRLDNIRFDVTAKVTGNINHKEGLWGSWEGNFILTSPTDPASGWKGVLSSNPQGDCDKWPDSCNLQYYRGNGFGAYKNTHIEFTFDFSTWMFEGYLSEN